MHQIARELVATDEGALAPGCLLICDRDAKWSTAVRAVRAPNANAYAERFVRSIRAECLDRVVPLGERHFRQLLREYVAHYHHERTHQGAGQSHPAVAPAEAARPAGAAETTTRGPAQFLLPSGVMGSAEFSDTTVYIAPPRLMGTLPGLTWRHASVDRRRHAPWAAGPSGGRYRHIVDVHERCPTTIREDHGIASTLRGHGWSTHATDHVSRQLVSDSDFRHGLLGPHRFNPVPHNLK